MCVMADRVHQTDNYGHFSRAPSAHSQCAHAISNLHSMRLDSRAGLPSFARGPFEHSSWDVLLMHRMRPVTKPAGRLLIRKYKAITRARRPIASADDFWLIDLDGEMIFAARSPSCGLGWRRRAANIYNTQYVDVYC